MGSCVNRFASTIAIRARREALRCSCDVDPTLRSSFLLFLIGARAWLRFNKSTQLVAGWHGARPLIGAGLNYPLSYYVIVIDTWTATEPGAPYCRCVRSERVRYRDTVHTLLINNREERQRERESAIIRSVEHASGRRGSSAEVAATNDNTRYSRRDDLRWLNIIYRKICVLSFNWLYPTLIFPYRFDIKLLVSFLRRGSESDFAVFLLTMSSNDDF